MCGRYTESKRITDVKAYIAFDQAQCELLPRFNIAPTQLAPVVVADGRTVVLKPMRWGLVPFWATDPAIGNNLINARAETVKEKPAFRAAFKRRRCLVVADSFYEWQTLPEAKRKQPVRIMLQEAQPFAFAGLWETWSAPDGSILESFTIITGTPNELIAPIHHRMAVILPRQHYEAWLDPQLQDPDQLTPMLAPYPAGEMKTYPVSTAVNNPRFEDARCIDPLTL